MYTALKSLACELLDKRNGKNYVMNIMRKQPHTEQENRKGDMHSLSPRMLSIEINPSIMTVAAAVKAVAGGFAL